MNKIKSFLNDARVYWKVPLPGRYMPFREITAYSVGGIGAYLLISVAGALVLSSTNMIIGAALGVSPTHRYLLYVIATLLNVPLSGVRANMIDNTRSKAGKYRPYLLSMGIPTVLLVTLFVWFPYDIFITYFGQSIGYVLKLTTILVFNIVLQFFFNFFNDAYTNLIHVLSPNTQERTDVLAIKSVVYSLGPTIVNAVTPLVSKIFDDNLYDIRVYRILYPIFSVVGIIMTAFVFAYTKEKVVQGKTHTIQISFMDSFRSVAKNKNFWIIALAGWLGFLETSYGNVLSWSYTYAHACKGEQMTLINLITGNASLWGMLIAPFCVRFFGKKKVLIGVNLMNVVCILLMLLNPRNIIWITVCIYFNWLFGAFEQITAPAIQADIRDEQQYITGERIDGGFSMVQTIGNLVTLVTSLVMPIVEESFGIFEGNGYKDPYAILDVNTGVPGLFDKMIRVLILMAALGAFLNVVPYFFYNLSEKDQKGIVRVLKIRAMFEDYGNGVTNDEVLVEAIDIINSARETAVLEAKEIKGGFKEKREALLYNEEIEVAKFVLDELNKFNSKFFEIKLEAYGKILEGGLEGIYALNYEKAKAEYEKAKAMPTNTPEEKELRRFKVEMTRDIKSSAKYIKKYYNDISEFKKPSFDDIQRYFDLEDDLDLKIKDAYERKDKAKKEKNSEALSALSKEIKLLRNEKKEAKKNQKLEMEKHARFKRSAKPYLDAEKLYNDKENYAHFSDIADKYEQSKESAQKARADALLKEELLQKEKEEKTKQLKEQKKALKRK